MAHRVVTDVDDRVGERFVFDFNDDRECIECSGRGTWKPDGWKDGDELERCDECAGTGKLPVFFWIRVLENRPERRMRKRYVDRARARARADHPKLDVSRIVDVDAEDLPEYSAEIWTWVWTRCENWYLDAGDERTLQVLRTRLDDPDLPMVFCADKHLEALKPLILDTDRTVTDFLEACRMELFGRVQARRRGDLRNLARGSRSG